MIESAAYSETYSASTSGLRTRSIDWTDIDKSFDQIIVQASHTVDVGFFR